jgi:hypothetical protein
MISSRLSGHTPFSTGIGGACSAGMIDIIRACLQVVMRIALPLLIDIFKTRIREFGSVLLVISNPGTYWHKCFQSFT